MNTLKPQAAQITLTHHDICAQLSQKFVLGRSSAISKFPFFFVCQQVHSCLKRSKQLTKPPLANLSLVSVHLILHTPWCATTAGIEMVFGRSQCHVFHIRSLELLPQVSKTKFLTASFFKNMFAIQPAKNINNTHTMSEALFHDSCYQLFSYFNNFINILM